MKYSDWMPAKRHERIAMAVNWAEYLNANMTKFNIPEERVTHLTSLVNAVVDDTSVTRQNRSAAINARIKNNIEVLTADMRDIKRRYFFIPPLTAKDMVSLGLKPADDVLSTIAAPVTQPAGDLCFNGPAMVGIRNIRPFVNRKTCTAEYGVRIYYGILTANTAGRMLVLEKRPATGDELPHSVFTRRRSHMFQFAGMSGCEAFFCMRYENSKGEQGPWGTVISTFLP